MKGPVVFVFASNLAGRHGKGSALRALREFGAIHGQGIGRQGQSYAIPTKDASLKPLALNVIHSHVREFLKYAKKNPLEIFEVVAIGCGLAGYKPSEIAPMFKGCPSNVRLPKEFEPSRGSTKAQKSGPSNLFA